jgi:parallel beta-helix repeat protein
MGNFYPVLRFYFPQANGNWDAVIGRALISIAVFTDNRQLFDRAVDYILHGPDNGSLFKYIYPSGQCQETTRNLAHVQYGLLEYSGIARIAYTQGIDLFSLGNNRLALGLEYTMGGFWGEIPQSYGRFSTLHKDRRRDDCEYPYRHYTAKGIMMPFLERMCDELRTKRLSNEVRENTGRGILIGFREEFQHQKTVAPSIELRPSPIAYPAGATNGRSGKIPAIAIEVSVGENLQEAIDKEAGSGRCVVAKSGIHKLTQPLKIPSGTHLAGEGLETVLMFEGIRDIYAISAKDTSMRDVRISNLVVEGATDHEAPSDPNTGRFNRTGRFTNALHGIAFLGLKQGSMKNITLENITLIHFSRNGVFITGAENLEINNCNISDNSSGINPGPRLQHNVTLRHVSNIRIRDSRFDTSIAGCGVVLDNCADIIVERCEIARNAWFGMLLSESDNVTIFGNLIEGNSASGIMSEFRYAGCRNVRINNNNIQYNDGYGVEAYSAEKINVNDNQYHLNGQSVEQENINTKTQIIL